jgi:hypothetical protein
LSFTTQVLYSFCQTELSERACTPPWQLGELHEPGPVYFDGSAAIAVIRPTVKRRAAGKFLYFIMNFTLFRAEGTRV